MYIDFADIIDLRKLISGSKCSNNNNNNGLSLVT